MDKKYSFKEFRSLTKEDRENIKFQQYTTRHKLTTIVFMVMLLGLIIMIGKCMCSSDRNNGKISELEAYYAAREFAKANIRDDIKLKFPDYVDKWVKIGENTFQVYSTVEYDNNFGAKRIAHWWAIIKYKGGDTLEMNNWELIDFSLK